MKKILAVSLLALVATPALAQVDISIGGPGFYGRVDLGGFSQPQVYNPQPVYIQRGPDTPPPVYLRVPPDQQRNWRRYCNRYNACGAPVYFVRDDWYRNVYQPRYREMHRPDGRHDDRGPRDRGPEGRGPGDHRGPGDDRGPGDHRGPGDDRGPGDRGH